MNEVKCATPGCGIIFKTDHPTKIYHSGSCKKKANRIRAAERKNPVVCKTPNKKQFATKEAAEFYLRRLKYEGKVYLCPAPCSNWHITSKKWNLR